MELNPTFLSLSMGATKVGGVYAPPKIDGGEYGGSTSQKAVGFARDSFPTAQGFTYNENIPASAGYPPRTSNWSLIV